MRADPKYVVLVTHADGTKQVFGPFGGGIVDLRVADLSAAWTDSHVRDILLLGARGLVEAVQS